jgi:hypothetical protein
MPAVADTRELREHIFALQSSGPILVRNVEIAARRSGQRVRDVARSRFAGTRYWWKYPATITYDMERKGSLTVVEIGPNLGKGHQGSFGHWLEYGTSTHGPIKPHLGPALDATRDAFEKDLLVAAMTATTVKPMRGLVSKVRR